MIPKVKILILNLCLASASQFVHGQSKVWVYFRDKGPEQSRWASDPSSFLSQKALERRAVLGVVPDESDWPVSRTYISQLQKEGLVPRSTSRWINAVSLHTNKSLAELQAICPAVERIRPVARFMASGYDAAGLEAGNASSLRSVATLDYGMAHLQIHQLGLPCLHDRGHKGAGVLIAILDAGFFAADILHAFDSLWQQNRIVAWYDFVNHDTTVFDELNHGMNVMSIISGNLPGRYLGAAPQVSLALARTEDTRSETNQEEDHWLAAVEWADSLGADQIQSSLGYSTFDSGQMSYAYPEMDGNTTIVTRAADMAAARGILVVNSAGNEGNMAWRRISAPCDGDSVLCVGAIDPDGEIARFSGVGPSYDGRIKPDVCALGVRTWVINASGGVGNGSGTSFSAPLVSGLAACLRSAHPHRSSMDIVDAIRRSADRYSHPDSLYGYGVPNACKADSILTVMDSIRMRSHDINAHQQVIAVYPNPTGDVLTLESKIPRNLIVGIRVVTTDGKVVMELDREAFGSSSRKCLIIKHLPPGMYTLRLQLQDERTQISTFIRQ